MNAENQELKREIMKKYHMLEEKKKNTTDPKKIEEITTAILQCKMALAHYNFKSKTRKSKASVINKNNIKKR